MTDAVRTAEELSARFAGRAADHDRDARFPADDVEDLRAGGLLGLMVPTRLGGMGAGFREYTRVAMALARGSGSTALVFNMHAAVTGQIAGVSEDLARQFGAGDDFFDARDAVLRAAAAGALYGVAVTEREAGSRLSAMRTTYEPVDGGWRIRGHKSVCTGAGHLDGYAVPARRVGGDFRTASGEVAPTLSLFLVPPGDGLRFEDTWDPLGMRATASNGVHIDAVVPADALIGGVEGVALPLAYALPQWLVASYAAVYVGLGQAAVDAATAYVGERSVVGQRGGLSRLAAVRARVGRADARVEAARLAVQDAGTRVDVHPGDPDTNRAVYRAKLLAGDAALDVAASLTEACGLGALRRGSDLERVFRDARSGAIMPPSSDVCADVLGTAALGLDPVTGSDVRPW